MLSRRSVHVWLLALALAAGFSAGPVRGWGSYAHELITDNAVDRLPGALGDFYRANRDFLVCYCVLPDDWWGSPNLVAQLPPGLEMPAGKPGRDEVDRHFFTVDEDAYIEARGSRDAMQQQPIDREEALQIFKQYVRRHGQEALEKFVKQNPGYTGGLEGLPAAMLDRAGTAVWVIQERLADLAAAMKAGNWQRALFLSTVMAHYVEDTHVPLHTALDYNGVNHPNPHVKGIHGRWESKMIERNASNIHAFLAGRQHTELPAPLAADQVPGYVFKTVNDSFALVDELFATDDKLLSGAGASAGGPAAEVPPTAGEVAQGAGDFRGRAAKYSMALATLPVKDSTSSVALGRAQAHLCADASEDQAVYSAAYYRALWKKLGPSAKSRLWQSVEDVSLLWSLAWSMAGQPTPPEGKLDTPALWVIDYRHGVLKPYDPSSMHWLH